MMDGAISMDHGARYDPILVKAFINCLGVFPVGSLVLLSSGELAVVVNASPDPATLDRPTVKVIADSAWQPHPIQGWTPDFIPYVLQEAVDRHYYDELIPVTGPAAMEWSRKLAQREGIFTGVSGGATLAVAMQLAEKAAPGSVICCMLPDTGERYLSTPLFEGIETEMSAEEVALSRSTPGFQMAAT
jgi:cysteine synthase A